MWGEIFLTKVSAQPMFWDKIEIFYFVLLKMGREKKKFFEKKNIWPQPMWSEIILSKVSAQPMFWDKIEFFYFFLLKMAGVKVKILIHDPGHDPTVVQ